MALYSVFFYDAAGNYLEPLDSQPRVVELWVGNYPKETTKVGENLSRVVSSRKRP